MPTYLTTTLLKLRKPATRQKVNDFSPILGALADDVDAIVGPGIFTSGDLKITAAVTAPAGWVPCDGRALGRTDPAYSLLFAAIGVAYGPGDGATTFNVPDYRGRTIVGAGTAPTLSARPLGQKGGEETHVLTRSEMPLHDHGGSTGGVTSAASSANPAMDFGSAGTARIVDQPATGAALSNFYNAHEHSIAADGSSGAHNVMQPYAVANVWIKT